METKTGLSTSTIIPLRQGWPAYDGRQPASVRRSVFPEDAIARIYRPARSATTSGMALTKNWRLVFERRSPPFIEPLMGHTGSDDTLVQVELEFPTLDSAMRYADRQGLTYVVQAPAGQTHYYQTQGSDSTPAWSGGSTHAFSDATLGKFGLSDLQEGYGRALDGAAKRNDPRGSDPWASPLWVVRDPTLTLEVKRLTGKRSCTPSLLTYFGPVRVRPHR